MPASLSPGTLLRTAALLLGLTTLPTAGCGYVVGSAYQPDIRSVHVPVFTTDSFRRGLEFQLTEAVQNEIQSRTHFRLAEAGQADSRLTGRIVSVRKRVLGETEFDDPRQLQLSIALEVTWEDLRSGEIIDRQRIPIEPEAVQLLSTSEFAPEVGQSLATATQKAVDRLARRVVDMMEMPW